MITTPETTIRDIVADDFRAAAVFQQFGIDFCCQGNRTVGDACRTGAASAEDVLRSVREATTGYPAGAPRFNAWDLGTLVAFVVANHHVYVRQAMPPLLTHTEKLARVRGARHPELLEVARLFAGVAVEMTSHMEKEEHILFPYIIELAAARRDNGAAPCAPFGTVRNPIRMMEAEHESAGTAMARIRELTSGYRVPANGCATYEVCLRALDAFEADLHQHVHLENNILFPKAARLEAELAH